MFGCFTVCMKVLHVVYIYTHPTKEKKSRKNMIFIYVEAIKGKIIFPALLPY